MTHLLKIALVVREDSFYIREILEGIRLHANLARGWTFRLFAPEPASLAMVRGWQPDGIIANIHTWEWAEQIRGLDQVAVNISNILLDSPIPWAGVDDYAVGQTAARHLMTLGSRGTAFLGFEGWAFSAQRLAGFSDVLRAAGKTAHIHNELNPVDLQQRGPNWLSVEADVQTWLASLPRPVGIMACNDYLGMQLASLCRQAGLRVPDDVAIVGVDNDPLYCQFAYPPLSSVGIPLRAIGMAAARMLDGIMSGTAAEGPALLSPLPVQVRQSTDITHAADPLVAATMGQIRDHYRDRDLNLL